MKMNKMNFNFNTLWVTMLVTSLFFVSCSDDNIDSVVETTGFELNSPDIVSLIKQDQAQIKKLGYGNLIIPRDINRIPLSAFSDDALWVCTQLTNAGYTAYLVGGSIRDIAMNIDGDDFDVTTNATHEQMEEVFGDKLHIHMVGTLMFESVEVTPGNPIIDLATYQDCPQVYIDKGMVSKEVVDKTLLGDSFQRDLAFNALYYEPITGNLLDFHGGLNDILTKKISTMVDASVEMSINNRIIPRVCRFKSKYQFDLADDLENAMLTEAEELMEQFPTNITMFNYGKMLNGGYAVRCYENMMLYKIFAAAFPAVKEMMNDEGYKSYVMAALAEIDNQVNNGMEVSAASAVATVLYPAYKQLRTTMTHEEAANNIIDIQLTKMDLTYEETTEITATFKQLYDSVAQ